MPTGSAAEAAVQNRLETLLTDRLRHAFLEAALAEPRSSMRAERLRRLQQEVQRAKPLQDRLRPDVQEQVDRVAADCEALEAEARAQALQQEAHALVSEVVAEARRRGIAESLIERGDAPPEVEEHIKQLVGEAMDMLRKWKSHSQVSHALCDSLLAMGAACGESFQQEMQRRGLCALASTVADLHCDRCEVARCALRLLCLLSVELLVGTIEEQRGSGRMVGLGLEALNRRISKDPHALEELAQHGGRELVVQLEKQWGRDEIIALHLLNLRRRLRKTRTKSNKHRMKARLPPEDVLILRNCFESLDIDGQGFISTEQLSQIIGMLGISSSQEELEAAARQADINESGTMDWPEFLFLMSRTVNLWEDSVKTALRS